MMKVEGPKGCVDGEFLKLLTLNDTGLPDANKELNALLMVMSSDVTGLGYVPVLELAQVKDADTF
jgi:hypothetical protein